MRQADGTQVWLSTAVDLGSDLAPLLREWPKTHQEMTEAIAHCHAGRPLHSMQKSHRH